jgi:hypothetical protein
MACVHESDGTVALRGPIAKKAALDRSPKQMRDFGVAMLSVDRAGPDQADILGGK